MHRPHFRPRIAILIDRPGDEVRDELRARLDAAKGRLYGRVRKRCMLAWVDRDRRHIWSPSLDVNLRDHPRGTLLLGRFGPHPALMTAHMFGAISLSFFATIALVWSFVQSSLGETPLCLAGVGAAALGGCGIALSSWLGRRWGHDELLELATLLDGLGEVRDDEEALLAELAAHHAAQVQAARLA